MNHTTIEKDVDPQETAEWLESYEGVTEIDGRERAHFLLNKMAQADQRKYADFQSIVTTPYINSIPVHNQPEYPGNLATEGRLNAYIRWNAMAMVLRAGKHSNVGGHIATYQSAAVLYDIGFTHFFRGRTDDFAGDMVYIQGHSAPGIYGRAYLEGRIDEEQLDNFRRESVRRGLSSYPHPRLMPDFWSSIQ